RLDHPQVLALTVIDMNGRLVACSTYESYGAGAHAMTIRVDDLQPGLYLVALSNHTGIIGRRILMKE
ncbi:MAG: T9SS type A sorting domain-containing protein, partial [Saprospiraceae bacterium]|nr:T9SS type A sorting domain-containing protein [Saprospiraceae bacterium]